VPTATARAEAKGTFFTDMLENLRDPKDLFKKVCATKGRQAKGVCALRVGDQHAAELEAQAELLGKTFFPATRTQPCSLTMDFDPEQREARAWRQFTKDKLKSAVLGISNSLAAGLLGLSYCHSFPKPLGSCVMFGTPLYFHQFAQVHCGPSGHTVVDKTDPMFGTFDKSGL
jgi:hypothetical protein